MTSSKQPLVLALVLAASWTANAELTLTEIRTASKDVLVASFQSPLLDANEVHTHDLSAWKLDGKAVLAIHEFVTEAEACEHHIYLEVPPLINGTRYTLQTPHCATSFVFDERNTFCESINLLPHGKMTP